MAAPKDFITGFNHNVNHKGKSYHVQTEDSGAEAAHIITHLFVGGNILASKKKSYAELRQAPNLKEFVRELMQEQHKEMLRTLIHGEYDAVEQAMVAVDAKSYAPGQIAIGETEVRLNTGTPGSSPVAEIQAQQPPAPPAPVAAASARPQLMVVEQPPQMSPKAGGFAGVGGDTIFGEDIISERSLDEVILGYLAGDSGGERK